MPSRAVHNLVNKLVLRDKYDRVNRMLDLPSLVLKEKHRILLHDPVQAWIIGRALDGEKGGVAALLHVTIDSLASKDKTVKFLLEALAKKR